MNYDDLIEAESYKDLEFHNGDFFRCLYIDIAELYKLELTGGECHIVLDDYNIEDNFIIWSMQQIMRKLKFHRLAQEGKSERKQLSDSDRVLLTKQMSILSNLLRLPEKYREEAIRSVK